MDGPVGDFEAQWPDFMQHHLNPKIVARARGEHKTLARIYLIYLFGLMQSLGKKGWEVEIEPRGRGGYSDIRLMREG